MQTDHSVVCWVASTPSTCVWRHPCVVLAAQLFVRSVLHWAYLVRTKLPRLAAASLTRGLRQLSAAGRLRRKRLAAAAASSSSAASGSNRGRSCCCEAGGCGCGCGAVGDRGAADDDIDSARGAPKRRRGPPGPSGVPMAVLQRLGGYMSVADTAGARLVCRTWRDCLGAQVAVAALPPALWQHAARGQLGQLRRLIAAFPLLRTVQCVYERGTPIDARSMRRATGVLACTTPTLSGLRLRGMVDPTNWPALVDGLTPLAPRLVSLDLGDVCWPGAPAMTSLAASLTGLQRLRLHSAVFSRLTVQHIDVIASLSRLRELSLGFRTVEGTGACPMALDALTRLSRLVALDLEYTGLLELSNGAGFLRPDDLSRLSRLTAFSARLVPLPSLGGLAALPALRALTMLQMAPVSPRQAAALARCTALARLEVDPLPWELLPALGSLMRLRWLSVHLHQPHRGRLPPRAADALLALEPLAGLHVFSLAGQVELEEHHVSALASVWPSLRALDLCCGLAQGTAGFSALCALRRLRLSPYRWDAWSAEAPLILHPAELPEGLTCLDARDVWVAAPGVDAARLGAARASDFSWVGYGGGSGSAGGGRGCGSGAGGWALAIGPCSWPGTPGLSRSSSATALNPAAAAAARSAALTLSTPRLQRLVLRCVGAAHSDEPLPLPGLVRLVALRELDLRHSQITSRDLDALTTGPAARTLRELRLVAANGGARPWGNALAKLTRLTHLESLQIHAHERALNGRVRAAISSMRGLRRLTLVTSPDSPSSFAAGLVMLTRLHRLTVLRVGLGFGAMDALKRLHACVSRALPRCHFEALSDVDALMEADEGDCGKAGIAGLGGGADGGRARLSAGGAAGGYSSDDEDGFGVGDGDGLLLGGALGGASPAGRARGPQYVTLMRTSWGG